VCEEVISAQCPYRIFDQKWFPQTAPLQNKLFPARFSIEVHVSLTDAALESGMNITVHLIIITNIRMNNSDFKISACPLCGRDSRVWAEFVLGVVPVLHKEFQYRGRRCVGDE
jgi:hypothetical protein